MLCGNPFEQVGGIQTHIINLVDRLSYLKNDVNILMFNKNNMGLKIERGVKYWHIKSRFYLYLFPFIAVKKLINEVNRISPDIIHIHGTSFNPYILAALLLKKKYPVVITVHGSAETEFHFKRGIHKIIGITSKYFEKYFISHFPYAIFVSASLTQIMRKVPKKIFYISNGINISEFDEFEVCQASPPKLNRNMDSPVIIFVGRLVREKGIDILLEAVKRVKKTQNVICYIIGDGPEKKRLENIVNIYKLNNNVFFLGNMYSKDKIFYLKSSDIFVLPSLYESQGIVLLEAMACGLPVIAPDLEGPSSLLKNGELGLLFRRGDAKDLKEKIIALLSNNKLQNKFREEYKKEIKMYSWDVIAKKTVNTYREIIISWKKKN